jgi:hypothetical protein
MAKTTSKTATPKAETKPEPKAKSKATAKVSSTGSIEKVSEEALQKLQSLGIEDQLQSELQWCLGSYRFDKNPSGLYQAASRVLVVLNAEKAKKTKGVTVKLIGDLEKALKEK